MGHGRPHEPLKNIRKPRAARANATGACVGASSIARRAPLGKSDNAWSCRPSDSPSRRHCARILLFARCGGIDLQRRVVWIPQTSDHGEQAFPAALPLSRLPCGCWRVCHVRSTVACCPPPERRGLRLEEDLRRLGINDLRWHDLRHEAASRLFEEGLNPMEVASITGHKNLNMLGGATRTCSRMRWLEARLSRRAEAVTRSIDMPNASAPVADHRTVGRPSVWHTAGEPTAQPPRRGGSQNLAKSWKSPGDESSGMRLPITMLIQVLHCLHPRHLRARSRRMTSHLDRAVPSQCAERHIGGTSMSTRGMTTERGGWPFSD